jgi:acyl carrier protein
MLSVFPEPRSFPLMPPTNSPSAELVTVVIALVDRVKTDSKCHVHAATRLLEDAGIDSLRLMELIDDAQRECGVTFLPEDYSVENFATVASIVALIQERRHPCSPYAGA